jgi:hypothetical protein
VTNRRRLQDWEIGAVSRIVVNAAAILSGV